MNEVLLLLSEAERYLSQRDADRAVRLTQEAKRLDGASVEPDVMMATIAIHLGRFSDAGLILDGVASRSPSHARARMLRGLVHEASEEVDRAASAFEDATRCDPAMMPAWFNLGRFLLRCGRACEAARALEQASRLSPENVAILALWAESLAKSGDARGAARVYLCCVEREVANPFFLVELADLLASAGDGKLADDVLAAGSALFQFQGLFESKRAALALTRGDTSSAATHIREAVRRQPEVVEFLLAAASIHIMGLELDEARLAAERVLKLEPQNWKANHHLGTIFEAANLKEKATSFFRRAIECDAQQWAPRNNLAMLLLEAKTAGAEQEALRLLEESATLVPESEVVHYNLALAQLRCGRRPQAAQSARKAASIRVRGRVTLPTDALATALLP